MSLNYTPLRHRVLADARVTCVAVPVQIEGTLTDGRHFYFRYRFGWASVGLGATPDEAVDDGFETGLDWGDSMQGVFDSDDDCRSVFEMLLDARLARSAQHGEPQ